MLINGYWTLQKLGFSSPLKRSPLATAVCVPFHSVPALLVIHKPTPPPAWEEPLSHCISRCNPGKSQVVAQVCLWTNKCEALCGCWTKLYPEKWVWALAKVFFCTVWNGQEGTGWSHCPEVLPPRTSLEEATGDQHKSPKKSRFPSANSSYDPLSKIIRTKWTGGMTLAVECLLGKCEAPSSNPSPTQTEQNNNKTPSTYYVTKQLLTTHVYTNQ
jgi:hypothetical protein